MGAPAGVWEFITSKEAIELVGDCETPEEACRVVSALALRRPQASASGAGQQSASSILGRSYCRHSMPFDVTAASTGCTCPVRRLSVGSFVRADKQHSLPVCRLPLPYDVLCCAVLCCAVQLVDEAYSRWLEEEEGVVDDITAVVVKLQHPGAQ
jgi:hypothetical protein